MQIDSLKKELSYRRRIVLFPHKNPDGDALGACLGLLLYLKKKGHEVCVISPTTYSNLLDWLPSTKDIIVFSNENREFVKEKILTAELIFLIDFNDLSRINPLDEIVLKNSSALKILIDHHQNPTFFDFMFSEVNASSTTLLIYKWIEAMGEEEKITPDIATCLYTGIVSDTGRFSFALNVETHFIASKLIEKGAQVHLINDYLYGNYPLSRLRLLSCVLESLFFLRDFSTVYMSLSAFQMKTHEYKKGDSEGFVNYGLHIEGSVFSAFFIEDLELGITKISFRSKKSFDVNAFARNHFEGGGHKNAAGGSSLLGLKETIKKFLKILPFYKDQLNLIEK